MKMYRVFKSRILSLFRINQLLVILLGVMLLTGCFPEARTERIKVRALRGAQVFEGEVLPGGTVRDALSSIGAVYEVSDEVRPGLNRLVNEDTEIQITIIDSEDVTSDETIPFESQLIRSETVAEGETYILQRGKSGAARVTKRRVLADGVLRSESIVSRVVLEMSIPEILMVGVKSDLAPIRIPGKIVYLANGNLWLMRETTGSRQMIYAGGDADGRILDLSDNGRFLLFSRQGRQADEINTLWMMDVDNWVEAPISLRVSNVIHFAKWLPGETLRVLYSSVTVVDDAPGWRANNDLKLRMVSESGMLIHEETVYEPADAEESDTDASAPNGRDTDWWGTEFELASDGRSVIAVHGNRIDWIDRMSGTVQPLLRIQPYGRARSDWAWLPGVSLSADGKTLVFTYQGDISGARSTFDPSDFNIGKYDFESGSTAPLVLKTGLFTAPTLSPRFADGTSCLAFLTAVNPLQSETSRYRVAVSDLEGRDVRIVYPQDETLGIEPQQLVWAPTDDPGASRLAFLDDGNIWLVNPFTGIYNQITIDRSVEQIIWK